MAKTLWVKDGEFPAGYRSVAARKAEGKDARLAVPRSSHANWSPAADRRDPVGLLEEQNADRVDWLVPIRHARMRVSPFTFYRGTARIMASDLATTPVSGLNVQLGGDAHLSNFGVYASSQRNLVFDANDFDETLPGPWEWDLQRLATGRGGSTPRPSTVGHRTTGSMGYQRSAELAGQAMRSLPGDHATRPLAQMLTGWMQVLAGTWDVGIDNLGRSVQLAHSRGLLGTEVEAEALLAIAFLSRGDFEAAEPLVREALDAWEEGGIRHFLAAGAVVAGPAALVAASAGQVELARVQLAHVREAMTMFGPILPWLAVILGAFAAAAYALLGDQQQAGRHLAGAAELTVGAADSKLLTRATPREIAEELFVSPETVKTQTGAIYRKLGVSSRREVQELGDRLRVDRGSRPLRRVVHR